MGKCLFFDADGTILDIVKGTPEDTKLALQQLRKTDTRLSSVPAVQMLLFLNIL